MARSYKPPITVNFIWNPSDSDLVIPILNTMRKTFARDKDRPFSRSLNISIFHFSSSNGKETPSGYPLPLADKSIIFIFTSLNTLGEKNWKKYVESIPTDDSLCVVPIALSKDGLYHAGSLDGLNCIRAFEWPSVDSNLFATVTLAHEIYRHGLVDKVPKDSGSSLSIKLFLSHSKSEKTGPSYSKKVKNFIDNTSMKQFFDATEIAPGFSFSDEIETHIKDSTLVAFASDSYSSRYWCQREILCAKENNRPILSVDCLSEYEDRVFPAASNIPCVHISATEQLSDTDVLRILSAAIIETIRFEFSLKSLKKYKDEKWIGADYELFARPPEIRQILKLKEKNIRNVCYPEPSIFSEEADWLTLAGVRAYTPLWDQSKQHALKGIRIGISVSDVNEHDFSSSHAHSDQLVRFAQDIARHSLARSATLIYGGDLRPSGFTEFILDEAAILKERLRDTALHIENHLAWPIHIEDKRIKAWRAKYSQIMDTVEHTIPEDIADGISESVFLAPNSFENSYIWSRSLTKMRDVSIKASTVRICAGGKASGYKGKMPGVLEEIMIALTNNKPIFLFGGFDGIVGDVCKAILNKSVPFTLTEEWQISNNTGYLELQKLASTHNNNCSYEQLVSTIHSVDLTDLSSKVGLNEQEYRRLMETPFVDECVYTFLKGLSTLTS
jgi:hypothetical protein